MPSVAFNFLCHTIVASQPRCHQSPPSTGYCTGNSLTTLAATAPSPYILCWVRAETGTECLTRAQLARKNALGKEQTPISAPLSDLHRDRVAAKNGHPGIISARADTSLLGLLSLFALLLCPSHVDIRRHHLSVFVHSLWVDPIDPAL